MSRIVFFVFVLLFSSCSTLFNSEESDKVVAVAVGKKLTVSQLAKVIPKDVNSIDSVSFAQAYIERWVKNQLLLEKAEINLENKMLDDVNVMIENYKTSLLIFKYQQRLIQQKMDTVVTDSQISEYYAKNSQNFRLDSNVVKAVFVQIPKSASNVSSVSRWVKSNKEADLISLEDYCYQNAQNFNMGEEWVYLSTILDKLPSKGINQDSFLKYSRYIESADSAYRYYLSIKDYRLVNDTTPMYFVESQINDILLNHRKVKFIKDLENNIYSDAVNFKHFTIYAN